MNGDQPRISVGLPIRNGARFLEQTLDSLLNQSFRKYELVISDNASTDSTEAICRTYASEDSRIRYYRNTENIGANANFNRVFELSRGEYFKWASADDICEPDCLVRCLSVLESDSTVVLAYPKAKFIDAAGRTVDKNDPGWDLRSELPSERLRYVIRESHWVNAFYGLVRSAALAKTRLMPDYPGGDYRLLGELSLLGKFVELPECLFYRRLHSEASSQNTRNLEWMLEFHRGDRKHIFMPFWNLFVDHLKTIVRSQLQIGQKSSLTASLLRRMYWERRQLLEELRLASSMCIARRRPFKSHAEQFSRKGSVLK